MNSLVKDLSTLTTLPEKTLDKLAIKSATCIAQTVYEDILADKNSEVSRVDTGIGVLAIKHVGNELKYHFDPSIALEHQLREVLASKKQPVDEIAISALVKQFKEVFKDFCE